MTGLAAWPVSPRRGAPWRAMTRVTWIQHRVTLIGAAVLIAGIAIVTVVSGLGTHATYARYVADGCPASPTGTDCLRELNSIASRTGSLSLLSVALMVLPVLFGLFIGAPMLAREIEAGTLHFAWTQGVGRTRWLIGKLAVTGVAVAVSASALGAVALWYVGPFDGVGLASHWQTGQFSTSPMTLPAWSLFAVALGTLLGFVIRRTVEAMAATAAVIGGFTASNVLWLHNTLLGLAVRTAPGTPSGTGLGAINTYATAEGIGGPTGSWLVAGSYTGPDGHRLDDSQVDDLLRRLYASENNTKDVSGFLARNHYTYWLNYQPAGRLWMFEAVEVTGLLVLAAACVAVTMRRARRGP